MRKIPTLFERDESRRYVTSEVNPLCQWVLDGEGGATRKWDGTCVHISHIWYDGPRVAVEMRREVKPGKQHPAGFRLVEHDPTTGKSFGWEPYGDTGFADFVDEALGDDPSTDDWPEGTYELIGPRVNGNPDRAERHALVPHGVARPEVEPERTYDGLREWLTACDWEGLVYHHPDGRMAKIKRRDFPKVQP